MSNDQSGSEGFPASRPQGEVIQGTSNAVDTTPEPPPRPETKDGYHRWFGILVILIAFGGVGGWAGTAPIDGAVVAQGTVTVDSYRKSVEHLDGGIVQSLEVRDGDIVEKGDLLVQLDETQARASYLVNHNQLLSELAREARLQAEMDGQDSIDFPEQVRNAAENNTRTERTMRTQRREFETRRDALEGELEVLEQRIEQLQEQVKGMEAQRSARERTIASLEEELESKRGLAERELIPSAELRPLERELASAEGEAGQLRADIASTNVEIGETRLQIIQRTREFQREVAAELRDATDQIDSLEEELQALEDTLRRKQIRAPVSGEVVNRQVHSEQGVIRPGEPILDIVPADEPLVVEGEVRPQDINNVDIGMESDVRFTAFSFRTTPVVQGEVVNVSADAIEDDDGDEPYYLARVVVSDDQIARLGDNVSLRAGMPVDIMIKTGERTPMEYLAKPLTDALARSFTED